MPDQETSYKGPQPWMEEEITDVRFTTKEALGQKRLDQIKRHEVSSWHVSLREDGLSPAYADRFLALLRHTLNMAVEWENAAEVTGCRCEAL